MKLWQARKFFQHEVQLQQKLLTSSLDFPQRYNHFIVKVRFTTSVWSFFFPCPLWLIKVLCQTPPPRSSIPLPDLRTFASKRSYFGMMTHHFLSQEFQESNFAWTEPVTSSRVTQGCNGLCYFEFFFFCWSQQKYSRKIQLYAIILV